MPVRNIRNLTNIHQTQRRVCGRLDPDEFCVWFQYGFVADFERWSKSHVYAVRGGDFGEVAMCAAIHIRYGYDVGAGGEGLEDCCCCGGAGGECEGVAGMFEGSNGFFELIPTRSEVLAIAIISEGGDLPIGI